ncbi:hypothetical protein MTR67_048996 [Solanum verrucosum]|uniref:Uncharacterized protein n=1 Tax=Solanum verrucosum TaxID=315347 RepID=A0AAF0V2F9_SOLVR|nr:hypothetical protein MTR67_048996 [Solanum verrucosum]
MPKQPWKYVKSTWINYYRYQYQQFIQLNTLGFSLDHIDFVRHGLLYLFIQ